MYSLELLQVSLFESSPKISYRKNSRLYSILVCSEDPTCTTCPALNISHPILKLTHKKQNSIIFPMEVVPLHLDSV